MKLSILIKKIIDLLDDKLINLILISFFLVRIAPFTLPYLSLGLYSHYLYRLINFLIIGLVILSKRIKNKKILNSFMILSVVYFLFQALSVFGATNFRIFLINFEKIFSSLFFLLALYPLVSEKKNKLIDRLINVIIITTALNVLIELTMIISPGISLRTLTVFVHSGVIDIIKTNLMRGRIYFEFYDEITIPILFYFYFVKKNGKYPRSFFLLLLLGIVFISFFSNVRTRFLVTVISLLGSFFIFRNFFSKNFLKISGVIVGTIFIIFLGYKAVNYNFGFSVLDRFFLQDKTEDVMTISFRINMIDYAIEMGNAHPFFGVGLGNYYEYLPTKIRNQSFLEAANVSALLYPHNIFAQTYAETGLPGLISLLFLFGYFILKDIPLFRNGSFLKKSLSLSFWSLFIFALLNPPTPLTFFANFFVLRSIIET